MKVAIMQPYLYPYIGYFQLIAAVDKFVVYDNIQYTKKGWISRNRILVNNKDEYISLALKKDSDFLNVDQRKLAESFKADNQKLLRKISNAYSKAPEFKQVMPLIEMGLSRTEQNLFRFVLQSLQDVLSYLDIKTEIIISSSLPIDHSLRSHEKVIEICKYLKATDYVNPIGGAELYAKAYFEPQNIALHFIQSSPVEYEQFGHIFAPWLSIIDVLMFNDRKTVQQLLTAFTLV